MSRHLLIVLIACCSIIGVAQTNNEYFVEVNTDNGEVNVLGCIIEDVYLVNGGVRAFNETQGHCSFISAEPGPAVVNVNGANGELVAFHNYPGGFSVPVLAMHYTREGQLAALVFDQSDYFISVSDPLTEDPVNPYIYLPNYFGFNESVDCYRSRFCCLFSTTGYLV